MFVYAVVHLRVNAEENCRRDAGRRRQCDSHKKNSLDAFGRKQFGVSAVGTWFALELLNFHFFFSTSSCVSNPHNLSS